MAALANKGSERHTALPDLQAMGSIAPHSTLESRLRAPRQRVAVDALNAASEFDDCG
jgi:hypothetical protein